MLLLSAANSLLGKSLECILVDILVYLNFDSISNCFGIFHAFTDLCDATFYSSMFLLFLFEMVCVLDDRMLVQRNGK